MTSPPHRGLHLVTACSDGSARLWAADNGRMVVVMRRHAGALRSVAYAPNSERIITVGEDRTAVPRWDGRRGAGRRGKAESLVDITLG